MGDAEPLLLVSPFICAHHLHGCTLYSFVPRASAAALRPTVTLAPRCLRRVHMFAPLFLKALALRAHRLHPPVPSLPFTPYCSHQAALSHNAGHPEAHLFAALCATRRGDDATAAALLSTAHSLAPHNAEIIRDYGAILLRVSRPSEARPLLERAVSRLEQLHALGERTEHSRGALASAQVKLAACLLMLNQHAGCVAAVRAAAALEPALEKAVAGLRSLCEQGERDGIDTSQVKLDLAL